MAFFYEAQELQVILDFLNTCFHIAACSASRRRFVAPEGQFLLSTGIRYLSFNNTVPNRVGSPDQERFCSGWEKNKSKFGWLYVHIY